jgi:hypothetical protein
MVEIDTDPDFVGTSVKFILRNRLLRFNQSVPISVICGKKNQIPIRAFFTTFVRSYRLPGPLKMDNVQFALQPSMKTRSIPFLLLSLFCGCHPAPVPPDQVIMLRTFYKNSAGDDLLNASVPGSFKKDEIKIISKVEINGVVKDMDYYEQGFGLWVDSQSAFYYMELVLPTSYAKAPIKTLVTLRPSLTDTVTCIYPQNDYFPSQVFYNKALVWEKPAAPFVGQWPPITIVK